MSNSEKSQNTAAGQAPAEAENLAPAEADNLAPASADAEVSDVPREESSDAEGATSTVSHPPADAKGATSTVSDPPSMDMETQSGVVIDMPLEATRAIYVFNARVASAKEGFPTARCDVFVKSQGADDILLASLAPGQKHGAPHAKVGDELVAICALTKLEFARCTVVARRGYVKMKRSFSGKQIVKRKWTDPGEQKVVLGDWTNWRRLLTPRLLDYDMSHWDEPQDDPDSGKVANPFVERFLYYLVNRHQVLTCFFVGVGDSFSRNERLADLSHTLLWTWNLTLIFIDMNAAARVFVIALFMAPISALFQIFSRISLCGVEWGRFVTVPLWLLAFIMAIVGSVSSSDHPAFSGLAGSFVASLAFEWLLNRPAGIALRVWLYGKGWNKRVGIGPKTKWWFDKAAAGAGMG